ncbi:MAG: hypothetical protein L0G87_16015 [Renibacterium salmoninarum]|nr:hypothetical protein [Renibacterium salmoninarum]
MVASDAQKTQYATEHWFREQGLPYFVQPRNRGRWLLARCAPMLLFLALSSFAWSLYAHSSAVQLISDEADSEFDLGPGQAVLLLSMPIAVVLLPVVLAIVGRHFLARRRGWARLVSAGAIVMLLLINPLVAIGSRESSWEIEFSTNLITVLMVLGLAWLGIGSFLGWSVRAAVRQLSAIWLLAAIALPLLMLVVIFAFYSQETWQMTAGLQRGQIFWLLVFLLATGLLFVVYSARKELRDLPASLTEESRAELRGGTPLALVDEQAGGVGERWQGLNRAERANVVWVLVLAQCFQVLIFGLLVFSFLMVLATLSVPEPLAVQWSGQAAAPLQMFGLNLPIGQAPVRVCAFLAAIAALNFVVSVNSSKAYRDAFFDPLIEQTSRALAVHAAYQSRFCRPEPGPDAPQDPVRKPGLSAPDDIVDA